MKDVFWTEKALLDIQQIAEYITIDSEIQAQLFADRIFGLEDQISQNPTLGELFLKKVKTQFGRYSWDSTESSTKSTRLKWMF